jgi:hypothetical protein
VPTPSPAPDLTARSLKHAARIEQGRGNLGAWRERIQKLRELERRKYRLREILDGLLRRHARPRRVGRPRPLA